MLFAWSVPVIMSPCTPIQMLLGKLFSHSTVIIGLNKMLPLKYADISQMLVDLLGRSLIY